MNKLTLNEQAIENSIKATPHAEARRIKSTLISNIEESFDHMTEEQIFDEIAYVLSHSWIEQQMKDRFDLPTLN